MNIHETSWTSEFDLASFKYVVISQKWARFMAKADKFAQRMQDKVFESPGVSKKTKSASLLLQHAFGTQRHFRQMYSSAKFSFPLVFENVENEVEAKKHVAAARKYLEICKLYMRCRLAVSQDLEKLVKSIH